MNGLTPKQQAMAAVFKKHVDAELNGDLETTMETMTDRPHLPVCGPEGARKILSLNKY